MRRQLTTIWREGREGRKEKGGKKREERICTAVLVTWTRNSVLILLLDSLSPSDRAVQRESISSMKMMLGFDSRAISNICFTNRSDSPLRMKRKS